MSGAQQEAEQLLTVEEEQVGIENGYPVMEGERYGQSPISGAWYRVTRWEDRGEGRLRAIEKQEVDETVAEEAISR